MMERDDKQCCALISWIRLCALISLLLITQEGKTGVCVCLYILTFLYHGKWSVQIPQSKKNSLLGIIHYLLAAFLLMQMLTDA